MQEQYTLRIKHGGSDGKHDSTVKESLLEMLEHRRHNRIGGVGDGGGVESAWFMEKLRAELRGVLEKPMVTTTEPRVGGSNNHTSQRLTIEPVKRRSKSDR